MGALQIAKIIFSVLTQVTPIAVQEYKRRRMIGDQNQALHIAVLKHEHELKGLPIERVIKIGAKK